MIDTHIGNNSRSGRIFYGATELKRIYYRNNIVFQRNISRELVNDFSTAYNYGSVSSEIVTTDPDNHILKVNNFVNGALGNDYFETGFYTDLLDLSDFSWFDYNQIKVKMEFNKPLPINLIVRILTFTQSTTPPSSSRPSNAAGGLYPGFDWIANSNENVVRTSPEILTVNDWSSVDFNTPRRLLIVFTASRYNSVSISDLQITKFTMYTE